MLGVIFGWFILTGFIGPVLGFWIPLVVTSLFVWLPSVGLWILGGWITFPTILLLFIRYKQGVEKYLRDMGQLRYSVGGSGCSLDIETIVWAFLLPGRILLKLLWLERAPNARYVKTVPLHLAKCVRYYE